MSKKKNKPYSPPKHRVNPTESAHDRHSGGVALSAVVACFVLSGFAALLYQTAWLRQFSLVFGTSELAVATVLAAYMGGLAVGAAVAGRFAAHVQRPILVYGLLEAGIAVSALLVPVFLLAARSLYASVLGGQPAPPDAAAIGQPVFYLLVAFVVLAIPTGFMGATLPLLTRYAVRTNEQVGPRVALLYATNTAGAVFGTVAAAFILLPALGLNATVWIGVAVNALVFVIAALLSRWTRHDTSNAPAATESSAPGFFASCISPLLSRGLATQEKLKASFGMQPGWILPLMLISGANAFLYEVLWTRMLAHVLGGSIYAFATMLGAFLTGIALGGGLAGKLAANRDRAAIAFVIAQIAIAVLSIGVYAWMGPLIPAPGEQTMSGLAAYAAAVMLPATVFIGATLPLSVRILANSESQATNSTAKIYAWNTSGAILGAVLAGFFLIPGLGFQGTIKLAVAVNLVIALWACAFVARPRPALIGITGAALVAAIVTWYPARPQAVISSTGFMLSYLSDPREIYYGVGRSATVLVLEEDGYYYVRTNGLPEASIGAKGAPPYQDSEKWMTALPVVARPDTDEMLVIGFGGGVALEGVPQSVEHIEVIEIEPEVVAANRALEGSRNVDPLADPRFNIVYNDARNALRLTTMTWDTIVSQPSHPWTAGASHLFTREFVADAKSHLNEGGVFVQWMNSEFVDESLLRTLAATLVGEFENVRLYQPAAQVLVFLASDTTLDPEGQLASTGKPLSDDVMHYSVLGINGVEDLFAALMLDERGVREFALGASVSTDNNNYMATRSRTRADGLMLNNLLEVLAPYDPLIQPDSWIHQRFGAVLDYGYLTRRLNSASQQRRATGLANAVSDTSKRHEINALIQQHNGLSAQAEETMKMALAADPSNLQAAWFLMSGRIGAIVRGSAPADIMAIAENLPRRLAAVIEGWSYGARGEWAELARIDNELARTRVIDAWYPEVARLRAEWRTNVAQNPERFSAEALQLIERALLLARNQNLHLLRAAAAVKLGDADRVLESSRYLVQDIRYSFDSAANQGYSIPPTDIDWARSNLNWIQAQLNSGLDIRDAERAAPVLDAANSLISYLSSYPAAR